MTPAEREQMILDHLPEADKYALMWTNINRMWPLREDTQQVAREFLVRAVDDFDPDRGPPFLPFLRARLNQRLMDHKRELMGRSRKGGRDGTPARIMWAEFPHPTNPDPELGLADLFERPHQGPDLLVEFVDWYGDRQVLCEALVFLEGQLTGPEFRILRAALSHRRMKAAGESVGVSESRVSQVLKRAVTLLVDRRLGALEVPEAA